MFCQQFVKTDTPLSARNAINQSINQTKKQNHHHGRHESKHRQHVDQPIEQSRNSWNFGRAHQTCVTSTVTGPSNMRRVCKYRLRRRDGPILDINSQYVCARIKKVDMYIHKFDNTPIIIQRTAILYTRIHTSVYAFYVLCACASARAICERAPVRYVSLCACASACVKCERAPLRVRYVSVCLCVMFFVLFIYMYIYIYIYMLRLRCTNKTALHLGTLNTPRCSKQRDRG